MALNDILTSMDGARDALVTAINAKGGSLAQDATLYQCVDAIGCLSTEAITPATVIKLTATTATLASVLGSIPKDLQGNMYAVKLEPGVYSLTEQINLDHDNGRILIYADGFSSFEDMPVTIDGSNMPLVEGSWHCIYLTGTADYELQGLKLTDTRTGSDYKTHLKVLSSGAALVKNCSFHGYNGDYTNDYWAVSRSMENATDESVLSAMVFENCYFYNIWYAVGNTKDVFTLTYMKDISGNCSRYFTTFGKTNGTLIYTNVQAGSLWDTNKALNTAFDTTGVFTDLTNITNKNIIVNTTSGTSAEYYKCTSVNTSAAAP